MRGQRGLSDPQRVAEFAHAQLALQQRSHYPHPCRVCQRLCGLNQVIHFHIISVNADTLSTFAFLGAPRYTQERPESTEHAPGSGTRLPAAKLFATTSGKSGKANGVMAKPRSEPQENARSQSAQDRTIPLAIPEHELIRRIGEGSYGEVWLARSVMGTYRAVKVVYRKTFEHDRPYEREFVG